MDSRFSDLYLSLEIVTAFFEEWRSLVWSLGSVLEDEMRVNNEDRDTKRLKNYLCTMRYLDNRKLYFG